MRRVKNNFTLIEMILASLLAMVIMTSMVSIWYGLVRLQDKVVERVDHSYVKQFIYETFSRDIRGLVKPTGQFAGPFVCRSGDEEESYDLEFVSTNNSAFSEFGSDFCKVNYYVGELDLEEMDEDEFLEDSLCLIRTYTDNMNPSKSDDAAIQKTLLLKNIASVSYEFYDGSDEWLTEWNSTTRDNTMPKAIKMVVEQYTDEEQSEDGIRSFEIVKQIYAGVAK